MLEHYLFHARTSGNMLLALGLGSLFNHARVPNLDYRVDSAQQVSGCVFAGLISSWTGFVP